MSNAKTKAELVAKNMKMRAPYYLLWAKCPVHGKVEVRRKPNRKAGQRTESGGIEPAYPSSTVCTKCVLHAQVYRAFLVKTD